MRFVFFNICSAISLLQMWFYNSGDWKCPDGGFMCTTGMPTCINTTLLCDGYPHCYDGSDEDSCGRCCRQGFHD